VSIGVSLGLDEGYGPPVKRVAARSQALGKVYGRRDTAVHALRNVTVRFPAVEFAAVMGPSGSGKSTLLHCLAALEAPTTGKVFLGERDITGLSQRERAWLRRDCIGFVFQAFNLVPTLDAQENITLPQRLAGQPTDAAWIHSIIEQVGLADRRHHRPAELSGGQQQRVAIARALAGRPEIIFADEPTGNLDTRAGHEVLSLLRSAVDDHGQTIVMVTHDPMAAAYADRVVFLGDGSLVDELRDPTAEGVLEHLKSMGGFLPGVGQRRAQPRPVVQVQEDQDETTISPTGPLRALLNWRKDGSRGNGQPGGRSSPVREHALRAGARPSRRGDVWPPVERDQHVRDVDVDVKERLLEQVHALWDQPDERVLEFVRNAFRDPTPELPPTTRHTRPVPSPPTVARPAHRRTPPPTQEQRLVRRQRPSKRDIGRPTWLRNTGPMPAQLPPTTQRPPEIVSPPAISVRSYRPSPPPPVENGNGRVANGAANGRPAPTGRGEEATVWRGPVPPPTLEPSAWRRLPEPRGDADRPRTATANGTADAGRSGADVGRVPGRQARREWRVVDTLEELKRRARERTERDDPRPPPAPVSRDDGFLPAMSGATEAPPAEESRNGRQRQISDTTAELLAKVLERVRNAGPAERNGHSARRDDEFVQPARGEPDLPWPTAPRTAWMERER
jgi:putative ABC transport system ATP-binding protein